MNWMSTSKRIAKGTRSGEVLQRVFVHIGMSKAGSSAIQQTLVDNERTLCEAGISYPRSGRRGIAHYKINEDIRHRQSVDRVKEALEEAANCNTAVLSCEGFWLFDEPEIDMLAHVLAGYDIRVVLYLRRPKDYLPSSYRQGVKQAGRTHTCEEYIAGVKAEDRMNYPRLLERWAQYFPLRVRSYEAVKQGIEKDFMQAIEAPIDDIDLRRRMVNLTPSDGALYLMLQANRYLPASVSKYIRRAILRSGRRFDFMPAIDDAPIRQYGKEVVERWDLDVMRKYLSNEDLDWLLT